MSDTPFFGGGDFLRSMLGDLVRMMPTGPGLQWQLAYQLAGQIASGSEPDTNPDPIERIRFEELSAIRNLAAAYTDAPIGYCLDTCHLLAAGFDITTPHGLRSTLRQADASLGLANVHVIHANDSKTPLGSHVDRHARIGTGFIGVEPFRRMLAHPKLRRKVFISETPVERDGDDRRNMATLQSLAPG